MSNEILASSPLAIQYLASMTTKVGRGLRDWKLPFTGHHLVYPDPTEEAICYTLAPFLVCVVLHHLVTLTTRWIRRCRNQRKGYQSPRESGSSVSRGRRSRWTRWYPAMMTGLRNQMELKTLPASWVSVSNYVELAWTLIFCAIVIVPTMYMSYTPAYCKLLSTGDCTQADWVDGRQRPNGDRNTWANPMGAAVSPRRLITSVQADTVGLCPTAHHHSSRGQEQSRLATHRRPIPGAQLPTSCFGSIMPHLLVDTYHRMDRWCLRCRVSPNPIRLVCSIALTDLS